jgi:hypothetical protein
MEMGNIQCRIQAIVDPQAGQRYGAANYLQFK